MASYVVTRADGTQVVRTSSGSSYSDKAITAGSVVTTVSTPKSAVSKVSVSSSKSSSSSGADTLRSFVPASYSAGVQTMGSGSTFDLIPGTEVDDKIINALKGIATGSNLAKLGVAGAVAGSLYAGEQIAESLGVRGGAGFIGARPKKKIKHYDYTNMKALKRADKRIHGFVKVARKPISSIGYKIVKR